jgi:PAS domain S-box-containing protein
VPRAPQKEGTMINQQAHGGGRRPPAARGFSRYLIGGIVCVNLIVAALALFYLGEGHRYEQDKARLLAENLSLMVVQDFENEYEKIDQSLRSIGDEYPRYATLGPVALHAWLKRMQPRNPALDYLRIADAAGSVIYASDPAEPLPLKVGDRDYFVRLRDDPQAGLQISPPLLGSSRGKTVIVLARRLNDRDGNFNGVVVGVIPIDYFAEKFARLKLGPEDTIGLRDPQLRWIGRHPALPEKAEAGSLSLPPAFRTALDANPDAGVFETGIASVDGVERSYAYRRSERYGFYVTAGLARSGYLAHWRSEVMATVTLFGVFALLCGLLALLLHRTWIQQAALVAELQERNEWIEEAERVAQFGHLTVDLDRQCWTASASFHEIAGIGPHYSGRWADWRAIVHPDDREGFDAAFQGALATAQERLVHDYRIVRPIDGAVCWLSGAWRFAGAPDGRRRQALGTIHDITARHDAELELRQSRELLQRFLDHLPGSAYIKDASLRVLHANRRFCDRLQREPAQLIGRSHAEIFSGPWRELGERMHADDRRVLASGRTAVVEESWGETLYEATRFVIPQDDGPPLLGGISLDISERQRVAARTTALLEINELGGALGEKDLLRHGLALAESLTGSASSGLQLVGDEQETSALLAAGTGQAALAVGEGEAAAFAGAWADCLREQRALICNALATGRGRAGLPDGEAAPGRLIAVPVIETGVVRLLIGVGDKPRDYDDFDLTTLLLIGNDLWRIVRRSARRSSTGAATRGSHANSRSASRTSAPATAAIGKDVGHRPARGRCRARTQQPDRLRPFQSRHAPEIRR